MRTIRIEKKNIEYIYSFVFFSIGNISNFLEDYGISKIFPYGIFLVLFIFFILKTFRRLRIKDIIIQSLISAITIWGVIKNGSSIASMSSLYASLILFMPAYLFFSLCNFVDLINGFMSSAYLSIVILLIRYVIVVRNSSDTGMSYVYAIAVPMCVLFFKYIRDKKKIDLILSLLAYISMFFTGARGGLLFSTLCLIYLYLSEAKTGKKQLIRVGSFSIFFLFIYLNLNRIISYISQYSNISRNLNTIINGQFFVSDSRMFLYNRCQDLINKKPWGYGPMGSRSALYGYPYPHSLWYELQLDYGKVFGILFFISIILVCILLLLFALKKKSAPLIGTICFIGVFQLFVSSTLYQEYCIPAIIALIISWNDKCNQLND